MNRVEILALPGVPEIASGANLARLALDACERAGVRLRDGDVLCVAQKAVSKAEGALVVLPPNEDVHRARREVARLQAVRVVAETPDVLVVETRHGFICANAGIDASNLQPGVLSLLPDDPDRSARALVEALRHWTGAAVAVVITDTFGRAWRMGQTDVAIGVAGMAALRDERGGTDRFGRELEVTLVAVADELAAAADLARRKADGAPFVLVRGLPAEADASGGGGSARQLLRPAGEDLFRWGTTEAVLHGVEAARNPSGPRGTAMPAVHRELEWAVDRAVLATGPLPAGFRLERVEDAGRAGALLRWLGAGGESPAALLLVGPALEAGGRAGRDRMLEAGSVLAFLRVALAGLGWASRWHSAPPEEPPELVGPVEEAYGALILEDPPAR